MFVDITSEPMEIKHREYAGADKHSCTKYFYRNRYSRCTVCYSILHLGHVVEQVCTVLPVLYRVISLYHVPYMSTVLTVTISALY